MISEPLLRPTDTELARVSAILFFSYLITGYVGLNLQSTNTFATLIWPPSGIAFAAFIVYGYRVWPGILVAAFLLNTALGAPAIVAFFIALGNTLAPFAGASLLTWYGKYNPSVLRLRDNIGIVASALLIPLITATIGAGSLWLLGSLPSGAFGATWITWWMGDALGILVCTPFILKWLYRPLTQVAFLQYTELVAASASVAVFAFIIFWSPWASSFAYALFIPLTWVALRTGPRGVTFSVLLVSIVAILGTINGHGPFAAVGLLQLQIFLATVSAVFLVFISVVEERRNTLQELRQHTDKLETALTKASSEDEAKKEFLAVLAHELRNPLATILSSIELIHLQGFSALNTTMLLDTIGERARTMVRLLDDLLDISRISQKKLTLQKETVAVGRFIEKLEKTVRPFVEKHGHTLSIAKPDKELFLDADTVRLEQIFVNLVTNAAKYTKKSGVISIVVEKEDGAVAISVRDSGVGIPRNMLGRIFEPFFQINRAELGGEGLGIGLPLTRQLVEAHGGTIEVTSAGVGAGSEFTVRLPLVAHSKKETQAALREPPPKDYRHVRTPRKVKHQFKILVVDDNEEAAAVLIQILKLRGHTIEVAYTGSEAIQKALKFAPDIIILDIGLPDIDGYDVARQLRTQERPYVLTALTGYGQPEDKEEARQAGFDHHLTKPAGFREIEAVLRKAPRIIEYRSSELGNSGAKPIANATNGF